MGIKDLQLPTLPVKTSGGEFAVRGLSAVEMEMLLRDHRATFTALFNRVAGAGATLDEGTLDMAMGVLGECPELMARIIAVAADEPDAIPNILRFPISLQVDALTKIAKLTFTVEGDLGKLVGAASEKISGFSQLLERLSTVLEKVEKA